MQRNAARAVKLAYVDDHGTLTYGELAEQSRGFAAALLARRRAPRRARAAADAGLQRLAGELSRRLYAGVVPVAVNTLLTADDYAYMLAHSRAQAVLVSGALLPALQAAMTKAPHEVRAAVRVAPERAAGARRRST